MLATEASGRGRTATSGCDHHGTAAGQIRNEIIGMSESSGRFPPDLVMGSEDFALVYQLLLNAVNLRHRLLTEVGLGFDEARSAKVVAFDIRRASEFLDRVRIRVVDEPSGGVQPSERSTRLAETTHPGSGDDPRPDLATDPGHTVSAH